MPLAVAAVGLPAASPLCPAPSLLGHLGLLCHTCDFVGINPSSLGIPGFCRRVSQIHRGRMGFGGGPAPCLADNKKAHARAHLLLLLQSDFVEEVRYTSHPSTAAAKSGGKGCLEGALILTHSREKLPHGSKVPPPRQAVLPSSPRMLPWRAMDLARRILMNQTCNFQLEVEISSQSKHSFQGLRDRSCREASLLSMHFYLLDNRLHCH